MTLNIEFIFGINHLDENCDVYYKCIKHDLQQETHNKYTFSEISNNGHEK